MATLLVAENTTSLCRPAPSIKKSAILRWEVPSLTDKKKPKSKKGVFLRLSKYVLQQWPLFIVALVLTLLSNQLSLLGPKYSGVAIDAIELKGGVDFTAVWENIIYMLICYVASALLSYLLSVVMLWLSQKIIYKMRKQVFEKLTTLPVNFFDTHATGDIISHLSYDIDTINSTLSHDLIQIMTSIYTVVGALVFMWQISKPMILIFVFTVPVSLLFTRYRSKKVRPLFSKRAKKYGQLNGYAEEMLTGSRTISAYGRQEVISSRFNKINDEAMDAFYKAEYNAALLFPTINFINNFSLTLVAVIGGILYMFSQNGTILATSAFFITLGGVAQFVQYSRKFAGPINEFSNILHEIQSAFSAAERVFAILDEEPEKADAPDAKELKSAKGDVVIKDVTFGYTEEKTVLNNVSVNAKKGQTVAIVGPTGAGKTTIINLLMRFYDQQRGQILIDGIPSIDIKRSDLRLAFNMVLQDTWLFCGTIYDNIVYGREDATPEEVYEAAKSAKIDTYINSLPDGYNTVLSDDGVNISKGQKQLITIARAFLSKAPILILDEATSNVDSRTEIQIQKAMTALMENKTCFIIAHRLSTIQNADTILVVKDGTVIEQGNHEELIKQGGFYHSLYHSQFN
ncbi:MAG: ABC transporter ATP-binding protein [Clostridia bacterium]|nr:ABC transporter ATP-binding protein [Clostridia bacterium]